MNIAGGFLVCVLGCDCFNYPIFIVMMSKLPLFCNFLPAYKMDLACTLTHSLSLSLSDHSHALNGVDARGEADQMALLGTVNPNA